MLGFVYNVGAYNLSRPRLSGGRCLYPARVYLAEGVYIRVLL